MCHISITTPPPTFHNSTHHKSPQGIKAFGFGAGFYGLSRRPLPSKAFGHTPPFWKRPLSQFHHKFQCLYSTYVYDAARTYPGNLVGAICGLRGTTTGCANAARKERAFSYARPAWVNVQCAREQSHTLSRHACSVSTYDYDVARTGPSEARRHSMARSMPRSFSTPPTPTILIGRARPFAACPAARACEPRRRVHEGGQPSARRSTSPHAWQRMVILAAVNRGPAPPTVGPSSPIANTSISLCFIAFLSYRCTFARGYPPITRPTPLDCSAFTRGP